MTLRQRFLGTAIAVTAFWSVSSAVRAEDVSQITVGAGLFDLVSHHGVTRFVYLNADSPPRVSRRGTSGTPIWWVMLAAITHHASPLRARLLDFTRLGQLLQPSPPIGEASSPRFSPIRFSVTGAAKPHHVHMPPLGRRAADRKTLWISAVWTRLLPADYGSTEKQSTEKA